jgi:NAD(P)-dependent dehydrogenase (short-subunit alcohol dehydrogenase family)
MSDTNQRVALVTGGAGGLGAAVCRTLAKSGCHVIVIDVKADACALLAEELRSAGGSADPLPLDLRSYEAIAAASARLLADHGRIDVLINNAGIDRTVPVEEMTPEAWNSILAVNLTAPFLFSKAVLPAMKEARSGTIINIVSTAALRAWPNASAYHASKWGLLGFSHALHTEARPHNVRVTALIAGGMVTPFLTERFPDIDLSTLQDPANVAAAVQFLLSTPDGTVIPELKVIPFKETSWP